ncbi:MAG: DUF4468 domain-containing protein [Bacteroidales bacterium]|nr:DUF4468 domain-containing protein [Bacteroidales bacterium]
MQNPFNKTILFILTVLPFVTFAQIVPVDEETGNIMYREVVEEEGDKQDFFNRAVSWINEYYSNPVDVTKTRDPETGEIKGLHRLRLMNTLEDGTETPAGIVQYEFLLEFKEGRYRYTLTDFVLRQASKIPAEKWLDKEDPLYDVRYEDYLKQIDDFAMEWVTSLKEGMKPEVKSSDDNW